MYYFKNVQNLRDPQNSENTETTVGAVIIFSKQMQRPDKDAKYQRLR